MRKFLRNITVFFLVSFAILFGYGQFCEWFFNLRNYLPDDSRRSWAMKQQNGQYDFAVLGSSRAEGAFDMKLLDSLSSQKGINIASNGSGFVDNYLVFQKFLENRNHINTLYLQVDNYSLDPEANFSNAFHVFNFLPFWKDSLYQQAISHYLSEKDRTIFQYSPWLRYYVYNKYFSPIEVSRRLWLSRKQAKRMDQKLKANPVLVASKPDSARFFHKAGSDRFSINPFDVMYMEKIVTLCKEKNIRIICFTAPDFSAQRLRFSNYDSTEQKLNQILIKNQVDLMSASFNSDQLNNLNLFKDPEHLNPHGVWLHTLAFAKQMNHK
ncbi:MAG: hypothetical protein RL582_1894 [Bacteroidota bacterium]